MKLPDPIAAYRKLASARLGEEKIREEYFNDEMKTPVHLAVGAEAIAVGACEALPKDARAFGTYRNHALFLALTEDFDGFFGELYGRATGTGKGKAGSMHLAAPDRRLVATSAVVGTTIPLAVGAAFANAYSESDSIAAVFFGDGAVEEGVFWESLNFASLKKLRVLFVCEDNDLAIHAKGAERRGYRSLKEVASAFHCSFASGDGSSLADVYEASKTVVDAMLETPQPGLLHFNYHRFLEHVGPNEDYKFNYRAQPSPDKLSDLDPVFRFRNELIASGVEKSKLDGIDSDIRKRIDEAVARAEKAPFPDPKELYTDVDA